MNIIIITGASSGMGREIALQIDKIYNDKLDEIWLISRRISRLEELSEKLSHTARIYPMDLTKEEDIEGLKTSLSILKPSILMLVNASGYGIVGNFYASDNNEESGMVRLNCEALVNMTHLALPYMKKGARIIQFASAAAFVPQPGFSVYAATKSFVLSFSRSLNEELKSKKITVTAVCPGPVNTEFFNRSENKSSGKSFKKFFFSEPDEVVHKALYDSFRRKPVSIYSFWMNALNIIMKIIPHGLVIKFMAKL